MANNVDIDLNSSFLFVKVIDCGSYTQAAKALNIAKSTISDKISELEKNLGVTLMTRTTRSLKLTEIGAEYFKRTKEALAHLNAANEVAARSQKEPSGTLRITSPSAPPSVQAIIEAVAEYRESYPQVKIEIEFTDRVVDILAEGFDVAVRVGSLPDSNLIAKKVGVSYLILVATPEYLKNEPALEHPKDLESHCFLGLLNPAIGVSWKLRSSQGRVARVPVKGAASCSSLLAVKGLVSLHEGIALLPYSFCKDELSTKEFTRVLPAWSTSMVPVHLVYPPQRFEIPKVRLFLPLLEARLRELHTS